MLFSEASKENGTAYLWVIGITMVVMVMATTFILMTVIDLRITNSSINTTKAYYLAESTVNDLINVIKNSQSFDPANISLDQLSFNDYSNDIGSYVSCSYAAKPKPPFDIIPQQLGNKNYICTYYIKAAYTYNKNKNTSSNYYISTTLNIPVDVNNKPNALIQVTDLHQISGDDF